MQSSCAATALFGIIVCVVIRNLQLKKRKIRAFLFGKLNVRDYFIPPFALVYIYLVIAGAFGLPTFAKPAASPVFVSWLGATLCITALLLFIWGLVSFGSSFRVGIDLDSPGGLVTSGAFSVSRNPLYLAFIFLLTGIYLVFSSWVFFAYFIAALWLIDRQVCLEENALRRIYGAEYDDYCARVRRYL